MKGIDSLFSILIANYNNGRYLEEAVKSILAQTYTNWEVVIVDDASEDMSRSIYEVYKTDPRFRIYYNDKNQGCGYTKRRCIELANGNLCGFLDPDDTLTPDALDTMMVTYKKNYDCSIIYSTHFICNEVLEKKEVADYVGQIPEGRRSWELSLPTISQFAVFRKDRYLQTAGIYAWLPKAVDKDLYYKLETTGKTLFVDKPLYLYRHHSSNISLNQKASFASMMQIALKTLLLLDNNSAVRSEGSLNHTSAELAGALMLTGLYIFFNGNRKDGRYLIKKSLKYRPLLALLAPLWQISRYFFRYLKRK